MRDLLKALTGFLEKIFNFALSPFKPILGEDYDAFHAV